MLGKTGIPERVFLVQTNNEHWAPPPYDEDDRQVLGENLLSTFDWDVITTPLGLFGIMDTYDIHNEDTMYTAIMNAGQKFILGFGMEDVHPDIYRP